MKRDAHGKVQISMEASWRADIYYEKRHRKADFTLIAETAPQLFRDLACLCEDGLLQVTKP